MDNFELQIKWGMRVKICNLFPLVGTLQEMHTSRIMRNLLVEGEDARVLSTNGITLLESGLYDIAKKNEDRDSSITMNLETLSLFKSFINQLSNSRQIHISYEETFSNVMSLWEQHLQSQNVLQEQ